MSIGIAADTAPILGRTQLSSTVPHKCCFPTGHRSHAHPGLPVWSGLRGGKPGPEATGNNNCLLSSASSWSQVLRAWPLGLQRTEDWI